MKFIGVSADALRSIIKLLKFSSGLVGSKMEETTAIHEITLLSGLEKTPLCLVANNMILEGNVWQLGAQIPAPSPHCGPHDGPN